MNYLIDKATRVIVFGSMAEPEYFPYVKFHDMVFACYTAGNSDVYEGDIPDFESGKFKLINDVVTLNEEWEPPLDENL